MKYAIIIDVSGSTSSDEWMDTFEECYEGLREKFFETMPGQLLRTPVMFMSDQLLGHRWLVEPFWAIRNRIQRLEGAGQGTDTRVLYDIQERLKFDLIFVLTDGNQNFWDWRQNVENFVFVTNTKHAQQVQIETGYWRYKQFPLLIIDKKSRLFWWKKLWRWLVEEFRGYTLAEWSAQQD